MSLLPNERSERRTRACDSGNRTTPASAVSAATVTIAAFAPTASAKTYASIAALPEPDLAIECPRSSHVGQTSADCSRYCSRWLSKSPVRRRVGSRRIEPVIEGRSVIAPVLMNGFRGLTGLFASIGDGNNQTSPVNSATAWIRDSVGMSSECNGFQCPHAILSTSAR